MLERRERDLPVDVEQHELVDVPSNYGSPNGTGPETMGSYTRHDLPFYYALADAFTICDGYHCSVIGPTYPNRLMSISATIDPDGRYGGPLVETLGVTNYASYLRRFTWTTMMERLQAHGLSWKVHTGSGGGVLDNMLVFFKACTPGSALYELGTQPTFPGDFMSDIAGDRLPQVSWLLTGIGETEHPGDSPRSRVRTWLAKSSRRSWESRRCGGRPPYSSPGTRTVGSSTTSGRRRRRRDGATA